VVVRTRKIGHFFPGGTVDSFDIWLDVQAKDATGKVVFWSGQVEDNGKGRWRPRAFLRAYNRWRRQHDQQTECCRRAARCMRA